MKPLGVRTKLTLFYIGLFALVLSGFGGLFYRTLALRLDRGVNEDLSERAAGLRGYLHFRDGQPVLVYNPQDPEEAYFVQSSTRYYQIYEVGSGAPVVRSPELRLLDAELTPAQVSDLVRQPHMTEVSTGDVHLRFYNYVLTHGGHDYLLQVGTSLGPMESTLYQFGWTLLLLVPVAVLAAGGAGWLMARQALQPVEVLTAAARELGISQLDRRLPLRGTGDEIDRLAETFNQVFGRLERAVEQMKQFTASISHELRTPLTALRGEAEVTLLEAGTPEEYRRLLASQLEEFDKLTHMINALLTLARAEAGEIALNRQPVDLPALVRSLAEQMEPVATAKNVTLAVTGDPQVWVTGDADWLERVILNLLDNAIKFTPAGGEVTVGVEGDTREARLRVRDTGMGIPPQALPHIFERFYRADPSRSKQTLGAGLGLSLVHWIVEQHRGSVSAESTPDQGSCFTVHLPLASAPPAATPEISRTPGNIRAN